MILECPWDKTSIINEFLHHKALACSSLCTDTHCFWVTALLALVLDQYNCILPIWLWDGTDMTMCWRDLWSASHWISYLSYKIPELRSVPGHANYRWSWSLWWVWSPPLWTPEKSHWYLGSHGHFGELITSCLTTWKISSISRAGSQIMPFGPWWSTKLKPVWALLQLTN